LWNEGTINGESNLFLTDRDDQTNRVRCLNLKAEQIRQNLETGAAIDLDKLTPPEGW
jgi:hypothetical protein